MLDKIINYNYLTIEEKKALKADIVKSNDARLLFLFSYFSNGEEKETIGKLILATKEYKYIHYFLRAFEIDDYKEYIDFIITNVDSARDLYYFLYDVDQLDVQTRKMIINRIIQLGDDKYILRAIHYYFNILHFFDDNFYDVAKKVLNKNNITVDIDNYHEVLDATIYKDDYIDEPEGFTDNCFKGRNGYIPSIIVCHINNTYGSAIRLFYNSETDVSSHYVIRRDGHVKQVVSLDDSSWANGTSIREASDIYYRFARTPLINTIKDNANYYTFSIEHESYDGSLTEEQFEATVQVMKEIIIYLKEKYNYDFIIDREHIIGHNEVNPIVRTKCPGKEFPFDRIIKELKKGD